MLEGLREIVRDTLADGHSLAEDCTVAEDEYKSLPDATKDAETLRVKGCVVPMAVTDDVTLTEGEATRDLLAMPEALGEGENVRDTLGERDMLGHGDVVAERHSVGDTEGDLDRDAVTLEERDEVSENEGEGD